MKTQAELLRDELARITLHQSQSDSPLLEVLKELIGRVVAHIQQQRAGGKTLAQCAQELGIPKGLLHYWLYQPPRPASSSSPPPPPVVKPGQVSAELVPVFDGAPECRSSASAFRLRARATSGGLRAHRKDAPFSATAGSLCAAQLTSLKQSYMSLF